MIIMNNVLMKCNDENENNEIMVYNNNKLMK